jgi:hypothetical protein
MKIPTTFGELNQAADLPFDEGNALISQANKSLVARWGKSLYPRNWGNGYLHSSDHKAALRILLERDPTFAEVYASWHGGSRNIDLAREKESGGKRPDGWDSMTPETRLYFVLVQRYGAAAGSRIFDGAKDPNPDGTAALLAEWSGGSLPPAPVEPSRPVPDPPSPPTPPTPPVPGPSDLAGLLAAMEGRLVARLDQILSRLPRN